MDMNAVKQTLQDVGINIYHKDGRMKEFVMVWSELFNLWARLNDAEKAELLVNLELN
ncbi:hypothetical protein [Paenibacillus sp. FSL H3-0333]|uniref:hypothetical protein n=1 Tax=Paenibacillus sp. FSL H3-0333 TaxID=2921373 RepID=UPI0030FB2A09